MFGYFEDQDENQGNMSRAQKKKKKKRLVHFRKAIPTTLHQKVVRRKPLRT